MFRNLLLLLVSVTLSLFLCEAVLRLVLAPMDYLAVEVEPHPVLGHHIPPSASGHDSWGHRNQKVPEEADIIAIGDSMTYGIAAKSYESWPAQFASITKKTVYNAALGGYGPLQYLNILHNRAQDLSVDLVIMMIYPGNDLMDIYNLAYSNENWADYRETVAGVLDGSPDTGVFRGTPTDPTAIKKLRNWLASHSILYRLVTQSPVFAFVRESEGLSGDTTAFAIEHLGQTVVLDPAARLRVADYDDERIAEALSILSRALDEAYAFANENSLGLHIAIMPVREHVFAAIVEGKLSPQQQSAQDKLEASLVRIEGEIVGMLESKNIPHTNLRPVMQAALSEAPIYPPVDGHPNALGYRVVAGALADAISAN